MVGLARPRQYDCGVNLSLAERLASVVAAVATPFVIVGIAVLLFLNPVWVGFDQERSNVAGLTGYTPTQVQQTTGSILSDLVLGPPNFAVTVNDAPVLDARERGHMADVRTVLMGLGLVALLALLLFAVVGVFGRGRRWFWRAVAIGARVTVVGVIVVGVAFAIFFDQAFTAFHEIFFGAGTYTFDPRTEKLVQLFPDQFWSETSVAISIAILGLAVVVALLAGRLGREVGPASPRAPAEWTP
jgi:integral membrane protein (TIGR01906 family)